MGAVTGAAADSMGVHPVGTGLWAERISAETGEGFMATPEDMPIPEAVVTTEDVPIRAAAITERGATTVTVVTFAAIMADAAGTVRAAIMAGLGTAGQSEFIPAITVLTRIAIHTHIRMAVLFLRMDTGLTRSSVLKLYAA